MSFCKRALVSAIVVCAISAPRPAAAYSVLAHEANIDALWDGTIAPILRARDFSPGHDVLLGVFANTRESHPLKSRNRFRSSRFGKRPFGPRRTANA